jgi:hypothetical protein
MAPTKLSVRTCAQFRSHNLGYRRAARLQESAWTRDSDLVVVVEYRSPSRQRQIRGWTCGQRPPMRPSVASSAVVETPTRRSSCCVARRSAPCRLGPRKRSRPLGLLFPRFKSPIHTPALGLVRMHGPRTSPRSACVALGRSTAGGVVPLVDRSLSGRAPPMNPGIQGSRNVHGPCLSEGSGSWSCTP